MINVGVFSGIGGMPLGLASLDAGIHTPIMYEPEGAARACLAQIWDTALPVHRDQFYEEFSAFAATHKIDLMSGRIGKQKDWSVWNAAIRIGRPDYVIIEGLATLRGSGLVTVLQDLWSFGYNAEWHVIPSAALGAPYKGERLWVIAYSNRDGLAADGESTAEQGVVGKQHVTDSLLNEFRVWAKGGPESSGRPIFDKPRILRRDDPLSRKVDATRVRLLSDDTSPLMAAFIGFCVVRAGNGDFQPLPRKFFEVAGSVRNVEKRANLTRNQQILDELGVNYTLKNSGLHIVIRNSDNVIDYWPSTNIFIIRGTSIRGEGMNELRPHLIQQKAG